MHIHDSPLTRKHRKNDSSLPRYKGKKKKDKKKVNVNKRPGGERQNIHVGGKKCKCEDETKLRQDHSRWGKREKMLSLFKGRS